MYLNEKLCQSYYCAQASVGSGANSLPYYAGPRYSHHHLSTQVGSGFFQNIFRSVTPLMMRAGKYFGKKLLKAGSNVLSDVASGSSFKEAARARLGETADTVKSDLFQKLGQQQQGGKRIRIPRKKKRTHSPNKRRRANSTVSKKKRRVIKKKKKNRRRQTRDIFS